MPLDSRLRSSDIVIRLGLSLRQLQWLNSSRIIAASNCSSRRFRSQTLEYDLDQARRLSLYAALRVRGFTKKPLRRALRAIIQLLLKPQAQYFLVTPTGSVSAVTNKERVLQVLAYSRTSAYLIDRDEILRRVEMTKEDIERELKSPALLVEVANGRRARPKDFQKGGGYSHVVLVHDRLGHVT